MLLEVAELAKILIIYHSRSGNTKKMASYVAEGVKQVRGAKARLKPVEKATNEDLMAADGIIMGSPVYYGQMCGQLKTFIDESVKIHGKLKGKVGAAFTSSGGTASGAETTILGILQTMLIHGMIVQGRHDAKHYGAASVGPPQKDEIETCRELGKSVAQLASKLKG